MRVNRVLRVGEYTILSFTSALPLKRDYVTIRGKKYATVTVYDMPMSIGIKANLQAEGENAVFS